MIAYFLLVHRFPAQFKRLFKAIYTPENQYVVHIDKSSGPVLAEEISAFLAPYQGVKILESQVALWGGYSLVDAELRGMALLLKMDRRWTHFINLSGQDFPLKSQNYIQQFLKANPGKQFIRTLDQRKVRPDTVNRISHFFDEKNGKIEGTGEARPFLAGVTPYIGTQWKVVTRGFCEYVCHNPAADRFKDFYRNTFIADEALFQTVMMNSGEHGAVINDDLRMIDWVPDGDIKLRPRNYGVGDFAELQGSANLFARKFDADEDDQIFSMLEKHLHSPLANIYRAKSSVPVPLPIARDLLRVIPRQNRIPGIPTDLVA